MEFSIRALSGQSAILLITSGEFCVFLMLVHKTRGLFKNLQFILKEGRRIQENTVGQEKASGLDLTDYWDKVFARN